MPGVVIDGVEHWLAPIVTIVYVDEVEVVGEGRQTVLRPAADREVTVRDEDGQTVLAARHPTTRDPMVVRTNLYGQTPTALIPRLDFTYDAGFGPQDVHSSDADELYQRSGELVASAEAASGAAAGAEQSAAQSAATVAGFSTRLVDAEQEATRIGPAVNQAQAAASQAVSAANTVASFESRIAALEADDGGTGGTGGGQVFVVRTVNGVWDHPTLASAEADNYEPGQFVIFAGTASGPDWAPEHDSAFFRNPAHDRTA